MGDGLTTLEMNALKWVLLCEKLDADPTTSVPELIEALRNK